MNICLAEQEMTLLPQRALWWPAQATLLVADLHVGKGAGFRAMGQPVPAGSTQRTLDSLDELVRVHRAERLVVLGDLTHSAHALQEGVSNRWLQWRQAHSALDCVLIQGNHDAHAGKLPVAWGVTEVPEPWPLASGLWACHDPSVLPAREPVDGVTSSNPVGLRIAGHLHPGLSVKAPGKDNLRLACFVHEPHGLILPAFGSWTGLALCKRQDWPAGTRFLACLPDRVMAL